MERAATGTKVQVFVARSAALCSTVQQGIPEACREAMQFLTVAEVLQQMREALVGAKKDAAQSVNFSDFEVEWSRPKFGAKQCEESAVTVTMHLGCSRPCSHSCDFTSMHRQGYTAGMD